MEENNYLLKYASTYGLYFGLYWVFKYLFLILGYQTQGLMLIYYALSIAVPFLGYFLTKKYRNEIGGQISFFHAWRFGMMLYFFAALIVAIPHFIFYQFIAPENFLTDAMNDIVKIFTESNVDEKTIEAIKNVDISPIHMVIQGIFNNVFYGILLSIPVAAIVRRSN